ncbi:MAG: tetraacyldisaccharide 4'-kinase, partial [Myxococcales bacterium]|nr:tetraacyldisaccharide 4'-kinase [Myxococcales bacterium]
MTVESWVRWRGQQWLWRPHVGPVSRGLGALAGRISTPAHLPRVEPGTPRTLVVGGLALGGDGKTAIVEHLARRLSARGTVAIVGHGYRAAHRQIAEVHAPDGAAFGDEAAALRRALPADVRIFIGPERRATWRVACAHAETVLIDGGLFDRAQPRSLTIAAVDATAPRGVVPAGPLRAPIGALAAADAIWLHRVDEPGATPLPAPLAASVQSGLAPRGVRLADGQQLGADWLRGRAVRPICGIARPASFHHLLARAGARLLPGCTRADHHRFAPGELRRLPRDAAWVITAKDAERWPSSLPAVVVDVELRVLAGEYTV